MICYNPACKKMTTKSEAEQRNFNAGDCAYCGWNLQPTEQDNTMNTIDEILWYIERGYLIDEVKTNSDIRKQAKQALLTLIANEKREARIDEVNKAIGYCYNAALGESYEIDAELQKRLAELRKETR